MQRSERGVRYKKTKARGRRLNGGGKGNDEGGSARGLSCIEVRGGISSVRGKRKRVRSPPEREGRYTRQERMGGEWLEGTL